MTSNHAARHFSITILTEDEAVHHMLRQVYELQRRDRGRVAAAAQPTRFPALRA